MSGQDSLQKADVGLDGGLGNRFKACRSSVGRQSSEELQSHQTASDYKLDSDFIRVPILCPWPDYWYCTVESACLAPTAYPIANASPQRVDTTVHYDVSLHIQSLSI